MIGYYDGTAVQVKETGLAVSKTASKEQVGKKLSAIRYLEYLEDIVC